MSDKTFARFVLGLFVLPVSLCFIIFMELQHINAVPVTDEPAFHLIERCFGCDLTASSTICYRDYGTNVRDEFFTIVVDCEDEALVAVLREAADDWYPVDAFADSFPSFPHWQSVIPDSVQGFHVYAESPEYSPSCRFIAIADDNSHIAFESDP